MAKPKIKKTDPSSSTFPVLSEDAQDLASLSNVLGKPAGDFRRLLFRAHNEQGFYEWGVRAESGNILADVPRFVSSSLRILAALAPEQRALVLLPPEIFALLVDEAVTLEAMHGDHQGVVLAEAGDKTDREVMLKLRMRAGVALRDRVLGSLKSAVGDGRLDPVRKAARDASSPAALTKGLNAVAALIEGMVNDGDPDDAAALAAFQVGAARAEELRAQAKVITEASTVKATTGKRVSQRMLDIQDGRVLVPMDIVQRAFRLARRADPSILLPELNRLASLLDGGSGGSTRDATRDAAEPVPAPPAADESAKKSGQSPSPSPSCPSPPAPRRTTLARAREAAHALREGLERWTETKATVIERESFELPEESREEWFLVPRERWLTVYVPFARHDCLPWEVHAGDFWRRDPEVGRAQPSIS